MSGIAVQSSFAFERPRRRNIVIEAGAGTGKTTAIVAEVLKLLLGDETLLPERIVLVTFTEKAAGEIADRIHEALTELELRFDAGDEIAWPVGSAAPLFRVPPGEREVSRRACAAQLARIDSLRSQTIHSFCQSLLRQFPIEAGLDPQFTIIEGFERSLLYGELYDGWLDDETRVHPTAETRHDWEVLIEHVGYLFLIRTIILPLIDRRDLLLDDTYDLGALDLVEHEVLVAIERLRGCHADSVSGICDYLRAHRSPPRGSDIEAWLTYLEPIANDIRTSYLPKGKDAAFNPQLKVLRASEKTGNSIYDRLSSHRAAIALLAMTRRFLNFLEDGKKKRGVVDFDDLLIRTLAVLDDEDVVERVRGQFDYIFVDEFQDTDRIQAKIIDRLARDHDGALVDGRTVVVGDPKQSIYAFRRADPETYDAFTRELVAAGAELRVITDQYRSDPPLLDAVNAIFTNLFADAGHDPNVFRPAYHPLRAAKNPGSGEWAVGSGRNTKEPSARTAAGLRDCPVADSSTNPATERPGNTEVTYSHAPPPTPQSPTPRITILNAPFEDRDDRFAAEAESIAAWIGARGGDLRRYALLFRRTTKLDDYLDVFDRRGLTYALPPTRLFLDRPAPVDLLAVLRAIAFPFDRGAEVSAARSPYFALTDAEIMTGAVGGGAGVSEDNIERGLSSLTTAASRDTTRLTPTPPIDLLLPAARGEGGRRPDEGSNTHATETPHPRFADLLAAAAGRRRSIESSARNPSSAGAQPPDDTYATFLQTLQSLREAAKHHTVSQLIDLVIRTCSIEELYAAAADGARSLRHLEHLRAIGFLYDQRIGGSVRLFVEEIARRRSEPDEMEPSLVDETSNAVRILTVHTAKGLEFDSVILPDLEFPLNSAELFLVENPRSLVLRGQVETLSGQYGRAGDMPLKEIGSQREEAEARRLFYVAVTRAREEVVFVTHAKPHKIGFARYVDQLFNLSATPWPAEPGRVIETISIGSADVPIAFETTITEGAGVRTRQRLADLALESELASIPAVEPSLPPPVTLPDELSRGEVRIRRAAVQKRTAGLVLHRVLELWDGKAPVEPLLVSASAEQGADAATVSLVRKRLAKVAKSPAFLRIARAETLGREMPLIINRDGTAAERRIDRFIREDNTDIVVDYKSGRPSDARLVADRDQVSRYCTAMSAITSRPCRGMLWYIDVDVDRVVEV